MLDFEILLASVGHQLQHLVGLLSRLRGHHNHLLIQLLRHSIAKEVQKGAQSDVDIQRYKGLGEMNHDQLWESTMDPTTRSLYQVTLDDALGADEIFTILMSEGVEARREYIEQHALEITNLDV